MSTNFSPDTLFAAINKQATYLTNLSHIKERFKCNTLIHYDGHAIRISVSLLLWTKQHMDENTLRSYIILDENEYPILIEDVYSFYDIIQHTWEDCMTDFYDQNQELLNSGEISESIGTPGEK